jgi:hypothetical protein
VQRPTMKFVSTKTADQLDLQALHRAGHRTGAVTVYGNLPACASRMRVFFDRKRNSERRGPRQAGEVTKALLGAVTQGFKMVVAAAA